VCQDCVLDSACGPSCGACGAPTPFCIAGACRQCRTADDCPATWACGADGACIDPCAGTLGCAADYTPSGLKCSTAKVIGRTVAAGGINIDGDTTGDGDDDNLPSLGVTPECWDAQVDDFFRVYVRPGDKLTAIGRPLYSLYQMSLKLYRGTSCAANWKNDLVDCQWKAGDGNPETITWTAATAGWVTIVVDGASAFDTEEDWGPYRLTVNLACADANCCCR